MLHRQTIARRYAVGAAKHKRPGATIDALAEFLGRSDLAGAHVRCRPGAYTPRARRRIRIENGQPVSADRPLRPTGPGGGTDRREPDSGGPPRVPTKSKTWPERRCGWSSHRR